MLYSLIYLLTLLYKLEIFLISISLKNQGNNLL